MSADEAIREDIRLLSRSVDEISAAVRDNTGGQLTDHYFALSTATLLSQFYTGFERCLEKKLKSAKIALPHDTDRYHSALLALAIEARLISPAWVDTIQDLRGFRHYSRHAYGSEFRVSELREKAESAVRIWDDLKTHLLASNDQPGNAAERPSLTAKTLSRPS